jgi:hypothetical protein
MITKFIKKSVKNGINGNINKNSLNFLEAL